MKSLQPKTIDLYQSFFRRERLTRAQRTRYLKLGVPAATLAVMVAVSGCYYLGALRLQRQYNPLEVYLSDSAANSVYNTALGLQATEAQLQHTYDNVVAAKGLLATYPRLTAEVLGVVYSSRTDKMSLGEMTYDGASGLLTIAGASTVITAPADYVEKLKSSGKFEKVEYTGYGSSKDKEKSAGVSTELGNEYTFSVSCYIAAPAEVTP